MKISKSLVIKRLFILFIRGVHQVLQRIFSCGSDSIKKLYWNIKKPLIIHKEMDYLQIDNWQEVEKNIKNDFGEKINYIPIKLHYTVHKVQ